MKNVLPHIKTLTKFIRRYGKIEPAFQLPQNGSPWEKPFNVLRDKWIEVPATRSKRLKTTDLLKLSDDDLLKVWLTSRKDITIGEQFSHRGWYHTLYADSMRGKKVLDVGCGDGFWMEILRHWRR